MMHLLAYTKASAGGLTNQDIPGVVDGFASLQNNHYILQNPWLVKWVSGWSPNLLNLRMNTPALRAVNLPVFPVFDVAVNPLSYPGINWLYGNMLRIQPIDETAMEATDSAGATQITIGVALMDSPNYNLPGGNIYNCPFTAAIVSAGNTWTQGIMTLTQVLPAGRYAVVGMDVVGANLNMARLLFQGGGPRPGVVARPSVAFKPDPMFLGGQLGVWGEFESTALPYLEIFSSGATATQTGTLALVKVR